MAATACVSPAGCRFADMVCASIARSSGSGPEAKPMRMPAERTLERESKRRTRPTGCNASERSKEKSEAGRESEGPK